MASTLDEISTKLDNVNGAYGLDDLVARFDDSVESIVGAAGYGLSDIHQQLSDMSGNVSSIDGNLSTIESDVSSIQGNVAAIEFRQDLKD